VGRGLVIVRRIDGVNVPVPIPGQVAFWHPHNFSEQTAGTSEPQFLTCLKATEPEDRLAVWQGRDGGGLTAVVDFGEPMRPDGAGRYQRWGCITVLDAVSANEVLGPRLTGKGGRALQGKPVRLTDEEAIELAHLTELPPFSGPLRDPEAEEIAEDPDLWRALEGLAPEKIIEVAVATDDRLWRSVGFTSRPTMQSRLPSGGRPDLLAAGLVADAKRVVRLTDGPEQVERYLRELEETRPEDGPWRGALLQTIADVDSRTRDRISGSDYDLTVWAIMRSPSGRFEATRLV
jgi:hypothetical protein